MDPEYKENKKKSHIFPKFSINLVGTLIVGIVVTVLVYTIMATVRISENGVFTDVIGYLNSKYGNGNWQIVKMENLKKRNHKDEFLKSEYIGDGTRYTISSSYLGNNKFNVYDYDKKIYDMFLPTYYSIKYNLYYKLCTTTTSELTNRDDFSEFYKRITYILLYHYPYVSAKYDGETISDYLVQEFFYDKKLPDFHKIPELTEVIESIEEKYCKEKLRNKDNNDKEIMELVFQQKADEEEIIQWILNHITPVEGTQISGRLVNGKI